MAAMMSQYSVVGTYFWTLTPLEWSWFNLIPWTQKQLPQIILFWRLYEPQAEIFYYNSQIPQKEQ